MGWSLIIDCFTAKGDMLLLLIHLDRTRAAHFGSVMLSHGPIVGFGSLRSSRVVSSANEHFDRHDCEPGQSAVA